MTPDLAHQLNPNAPCAVAAALALGAGGVVSDDRRRRRELSGRDLACWCPLDQPCHADVLLEIANRDA